MTWFAFTQLLHLIFRKGAARTAMRCEHTKFDGCYCADCGKANPETHESHDWDGCKCKRCGRVRDEGHQWYRGMHYIYEGGLSTSESYLYCEEVSYVAGEEPDDHETCRVCGKTRELK
ncbi:MAG: hypothetical protein LBJ11_06760 [Oscillospiraceae bacterium]|nr:hypothetical protein [Oscillospiraceae bacterium]